MFFIFYEHLLRVLTKYMRQKAQISLKIGFYYANYQNLRPIFATARKISF